MYSAFSDDKDSEEDDDDDELELQAELDRIRAERVAAQLKKEDEEKEVLAKQREAAAISGNPLIQLEANASAKVN